jgi:hypothetical protein
MFVAEIGSGAGIGFSINVPFPKPGMGDREYTAAFEYVSFITNLVVHLPHAEFVFLGCITCISCISTRYGTSLPGLVYKTLFVPSSRFRSLSQAVLMRRQAIISDVCP